MFSDFLHLLSLFSPLNMLSMARFVIVKLVFLTICYFFAVQIYFAVYYFAIPNMNQAVKLDFEEYAHDTKVA